MTSLLFAIPAFQESFSITGSDGETQTFLAQGPIFSFSDGGYMMYPITLCAIMVLVLAGRTVWRMKAGDPELRTLTRASIDGVLFWGGYALVLGVLGTVLGIAIAAQAVEAMGAVETALVWGGIKVSLITTIYGLVVLLGGGLLWFALRHWHRTAVLLVHET